MFRIKSCQLMRDIHRNVSKASINKISYAIPMVQNHQMHNTNLELNCNKNINYSRWMKQIQPSNFRALSTIEQTIEPQISQAKEEFRDFMATFPDIIRDLTDHDISEDFPAVAHRLVRSIEHTKENGKKICARSLISLYKLLEDPQKLTPENIKLVNILGWCIELLIVACHLQDDILDNSETRRGLICWNHLTEIGSSAVNDLVIIENAAYILLRKHFRDHPAYVNLMELFHDAIYTISLGQNSEVMYVDSNGKPNLEMFNMKMFRKLAKYRSHSVCQVPPISAMYLVGMNDPEQHRQAQSILIELSIHYAVQNDILDIYGDAALTGKEDSDIQDGRCTWLAIMALEKGTPAQRKIMEEHYGRSEPESVETIKRLYEDLRMPEMYASYEEETFNNIRTLIKQISKNVPHELFHNLLDKIYRRVN